MAPPARQRVADLRSRSSWGTLWCPRSRPPPRSLGRRQSRIRSGSASLRHSSAAVRAAGERAATARHPPLPSWSIILNSVSISVALLQSFSFDSSLYTCDGRGSAGIKGAAGWGGGAQGGRGGVGGRTLVLLSSCCSSSTPPGQASWNCWISDACSSDVRLGHGCCPSGIATEPCPLSL